MEESRRTVLIEFPDDVSAPPYAGFWRRTKAWMLDLLVLAIPAIILWNIFPPVYFEGLVTTADGTYSTRNYTASPSWAVALGLISFAYRTIFESSAMQATLGKRVTAVKVTDIVGDRLSLKMAAARCVPGSILYWGFPGFFVFTRSGQEFGLNYESPTEGLASLVFLFAFVSSVAVAFTKRKQNLFDLQIKCLVVRRGAKFTLQDTVALRQ